MLWQVFNTEAEAIAYTEAEAIAHLDANTPVFSFSEDGRLCVDGTMSADQFADTLNAALEAAGLEFRI